MECNCVSCMRIIDASLQPPAFGDDFPRLGENSRLRVCLFFDKPAAATSCGGRYICSTNAQYPMETCAYRQLANRIIEKLEARLAYGVDVCEYVLERDLSHGVPMPSFDICVVLTHDWPTIHEDPAWAADWMSVIVNRPTVPTKEQIVWLFEKTRYVSDILHAFGAGSSFHTGAAKGVSSKVPSSPIMLPTFLVNADTDISAVAAWAQTLTPGQLVTKENFSAGKEGVNFIRFFNTQNAIVKLEKIRRQAGVAPQSATAVAVDGRQRGQKICCEQHLNCSKRMRPSNKKYQDEAAAFDYVHDSFRGGNKHVFMVQKYEKRFLTEPEKRLFYCCGKFLYAMGHRGWIGTNSKPSELDQRQTVQEKAQVDRLLKKLPRLKEYALIRFDFGPDALLSEIEVLPDMFGGPNGNLRGDKWMHIMECVAEAYVSQIVLSMKDSITVNPGGIRKSEMATVKN